MTKDQMLVEEKGTTADTAPTAATAATATSTSASSSSLELAANKTSTSTSSVQEDLPWVEKHRPRVLSDVVGNAEAVERLSIIAKQGNMPNIILSGPRTY
jgi:hypothetical protein